MTPATSTEQQLTWLAEQQKKFGTPQIQQDSATAQEHTVTQTAEPKQSVEPQVPPLTEKEAVEIVQRWVAEDAEYELPERRSFEEMIETLQDAGECRGSD